jgi:hypothetical protein
MAIIERVLIAITEVVAILVAVSAWVNRRMVTHPVTTAPIGGVTLFALWSRTAYLVSVHRRRQKTQPERG